MMQARIGRELTLPAKFAALRQVRRSQTGEEVRQQLCNELGLSTVKVIAGGKNLQECYYRYLQ